ncbi:ABC transporter permease [Actinosynnema sp. NPDC047251]|uniref:ABC-type transporter n=1 Tax=Saccharothrix espanaensis (strain ATCC 51144 / DSM 44229 / JCM 9112 / NBRC 15066 / NRRL 15764) TaxID=1179773 RepID=K0K9J1_SACES|nr:ABC transporter permease [Saccharothrix espanaensis]CCH33489.1 ABC-type transporter [Saccharothrix espanaensis DSM 44229]
MTFAPGTFTPAPGRGPLARMLVTQARTETVLTLRNGEQILLTVLIPVALLVALATMSVIPMPDPRVGSAVARILALAVISSAFTGQAIALGFDRRYGVLKRLAATALPRWLLVGGRIAAALAVVAVQVVIIAVTALLLGWDPPPLGGLLWVVVLLVLGTLSFGALGVLLGGALRAEIVLALANIIWFVLLLIGGVALGVDSLPGWLATVVELLPSAALAEGLHTAIVDGGAPGLRQVLVLLGWGVAAAALATRTTKLS